MVQDETRLTVYRFLADGSKMEESLDFLVMRIMFIRSISSNELS